ncbi:MAG: ATP-binding protein [Acidobacteria bacterium]|nr:ATP-binding protein [Acidobacteriota bacterium]
MAALVEWARSTFLSGGGRHVVLVDLPVGLPPVTADRRRIVQVLNNLLSNAAWHAPEQTPIRVAAVREDAHVAVSISDEGSGVAPERLPPLFSEHAGAGQGATAGHGLGLAISKGLVKAHGGRIRAERPGAGRGMVVTFTIPVAGKPAPPPPRRRPPNPASRRASSWSTTTRGCCASSATRSPGPATLRWSRARRRTCRRSSGPRGRASCCSI